MKEKLSKDNIEYLRKVVLAPLTISIGARAWLVGGCVRDIIQGTGINDVDVVCTKADELVAALDEFCNTNQIKHTIHWMGNGHATVVNVNAQEILNDSYSLLPISIQFEISQMTADTFVVDACGRDFICNSWYIEVSGDGTPFNPIATESKVFDPKGKNIYPCYGYKTFSDNPLRIFRAMDLICRGYIPTMELSASINEFLEKTAAFVKPIDTNLRGAALQIIHKIFCRLASGEYKVNDVIYAFNYMAELNIWSLIHPMINNMQYCMHRNKYHHDSVWQHTMEVIRGIATLDVRQEQGVSIRPNAYDYWVALLHDTGKVSTISYTYEPDEITDPDGTTHFYDHQTVSVAVAEEVLKDSPLGKAWTDYVIKLIAHHMDTKPFGDTPLKYSQYKHIRKLQWELGSMAFHHFLIINHADCAASDRSENRNTPNVVNAVKDMTYNRGESAWEIYKIPVDGNDIKAAFPNEPGVNIGKYIKQLYKVTFSRPEDYETKEQCLHYIGTLIKTGWANKAHQEEPSVFDLKKQGKL